MDAAMLAQQAQAIIDVTFRDHADIYTVTKTAGAGIGTTKSKQLQVENVRCRGTAAGQAAVAYAAKLEDGQEAYILTLAAAYAPDLGDLVTWRRASGRVVQLKVLGSLESTYEHCARVMTAQLPEGVAL